MPNGDLMCSITLGEALWEQFHLVLDMDPNQSLYPVTAKGDQAAAVAGPDAFGGGRHWYIDGRNDNAQVGDVYTIRFRWGNAMRPSSVTLEGETRREWEGKVKQLMDQKAVQEQDVQPMGAKFNHTYCIAGSWNRWKLSEMVQ